MDAGTNRACTDSRNALGLIPAPSWPQLLRSQPPAQTASRGKKRRRKWQNAPILAVLADVSGPAALVTLEVTVIGSFARKALTRRRDTASRYTRFTFGCWALALCGLGVVAGTATTRAEMSPLPERVRGFFCDAKDDSLNFLLAQAGGENEEMAANAVNKSIGKSSCAYFTPADAVYTGEHTIIRDGIVFKLHSFMFLPEKVERWSGTVFGSLQPSPNAKHDV